MNAAESWLDLYTPRKTTTASVAHDAGVKTRVIGGLEMAKALLEFKKAHIRGIYKTFFVVVFTEQL